MLTLISVKLEQLFPFRVCRLLPPFIVVNWLQFSTCKVLREDFSGIVVKPEELAFNDCKGKEENPSIDDNLEQLLMSKSLTLLPVSSNVANCELLTLTVSKFPQFLASTVLKLLLCFASIEIRREQLLAYKVCRLLFPVICVILELLAFNDCKGKEENPSIDDKLEQLLMSKEVTLVQLVRSSFVN